MKYSTKHNTLTRPVRRTAALLCAAMLGLGLATARTSAQVTGPLPTSPATPTPFQAPVFHSGGGPGAAYPIDTASAPYLDPLIDPLQGQLQGTPTELYSPTGAAPYSFTQIPSFLLGNYDPTRPPTGLISDGAGGLINVYYPNHFADGNVLSWAAPFVYTPEDTGTVTVDDANNTIPATFVGGVATASGFTSTNFNPITDPVANPSAGTASGGEYLRLPQGTNGSAIWTLVEPTAGNYAVYFHVPSDLPDVNGVPEVRDTQVLYSIAVRDAAGNVTLTTNATASQVEANDTQFLAGPFQVATGGSVTVTLARSTSAPVINNGADYLVADSITLQPTVGDVQSAPTAITRNRFPAEFASTVHPLQYWGIFVPAGENVAMSNVAPNSGTTPSQQAVASGNPDTTGAAPNPTGLTTTATYNAGNILLHSGNVAVASITASGTPDTLRLVRQLVYFGRSDPAASVSSSVDDSAPPPGFTGTGTTVNNATASNGEYKVSTASGGLVTVNSAAVATWTVPAPSAGPGAGFFVYAHIPATPNGETRLNQVYYTVTANGVTYGPVHISQQTQGADALVVLPTGAIQAAAGSSVTVKLFALNNSTTAPVNGSVVVADSVTVSTGTGQGAIYCVDGFNGSVVWRYETPGSANGASSPVFASPAVARINVVVTPPVYTNGVITTPAVYANRLVVIVGDNNGLVYCLDAIGNGDGTSNVNVLAKDASGNPIPSLPNVVPQPAYVGGAYGAAGTTPLALTDTAAADALTAHVGTTGVYWIYRPDVNLPKYITGTNVGKLKAIDPTTDLPVPGAFSTASPNIFVDPTVNTGPTIAAPTLPVPTQSNSMVYIGNSNGVLYALDGGGAPIDGTTQATYDATGDTFNVSQDLQQANIAPLFPKTVPLIPTTQTRWWFSLRGVDPNSQANTSAADVESAPAIYTERRTTTVAGVTTTAYHPTIYIGSAHEQETTSNVGRLYALDGIYGPSGNGGRLNPANNTPTAANYGGPGAFNYNVSQIPQISKTDTTDWSFPDGIGTTSYATGKSSNGAARPALGNMTGSPVVFTNTDDTAGVQTRIYIAASSGLEYPATVRPDDTQTGRLWAVNLDGSVGKTAKTGANIWAYPLANDPNNAALDKTNEPVPPIGSFLHGTPAIGFVQFPNVTTNGDGTAYTHTDAAGSVNGRPVPMLYIGTRGVNDSALYAVDIDGDETAATDQRTIYRTVSPDGSIYQSSPALITNATINTTGVGGTNNGNGGAVYAVAGNSMYDYSATPISNPFPGLAYPLIRLDRTFVGVGPVSSPTLAGADTTDISNPFLTSGIGTAGLTNTSGFTTNTTDWVYIGDSSSGFCRGITPLDSSYGGIPIGLTSIVPYDPSPILTPPLDRFIQTFLVKTQTSVKSTDAEPIGLNAPLPVFEWGESAYIRFTNAVPPNRGKDPTRFVYDTLKFAKPDNTTPAVPIPFYTTDGSTDETITFDLSDYDSATNVASGAGLGSQQVQPILVTTPPDGFIVDAAATPPSSFAPIVTNLANTAGNRYLGTYTYAVGDAPGSTPGARRRVQNVKQIVEEYDYNGGGLTDINNYTYKGRVIAANGDATGNNIVTQSDAKGNPIQAFTKIAAIDQPVFGILNPLGVRGGGLNLLSPTLTSAVPIGDGFGATGDAAGPFRSVQSPPTLSTSGGTTTTVAGDNFALQALANGNNYPTVAPPSSSGVTGNPTVLANGANDPTGVSAGTNTAVVVTATGLISHNSVGDNQEISPGSTGQYSNTSTNGLLTSGFGGYSLNVFDRSALFALGQSLRLKMTTPPTATNVPQTGGDGLYWNSNVPTNTGYGVTLHDSVVNFLPWETAPTPYIVGINTSLDYPNIASGNITQNAASLYGSSGGDLSSNSVTLPQAKDTVDTAAGVTTNRVMYGDPVQVKITVPHYQPANQQLYQQNSGAKYGNAGEIAPVDTNGMNQIILPQAFPMGYVTTKRLYVPTANGGLYNPNRPYRDVHIYTGVPINMQTSIANPTTDIGQVPAAFGVQTESDPALSYFTPYSAGVNSPNPFFAYFKPLEVHNDGNVNLLNVHFDQKASSAGVNQTVHLYSDTVSLLSILDGYDINGTTGPRVGTLPPSQVPEQPYLIRTSLDSDLFRAYGQNPFFNNNAAYPGATFHKPAVGSDQPSILSVPDAPESYVAGASLPSSPNPVAPNAVNGVFKSAPFVSIAFPFGTPAGTYTMSPAGALRLFEGLDTAAPNAYSLSATAPGNTIPSILYPPKYGGVVGGIGGYIATIPGPVVDNTDAGQPKDTNGNDEDIYNGSQPLSTTGTQLSGTVIEHRLTDGFTYGAVPMIDGGPAKTGTGANPAIAAPDFAPAAFRDPATGNLSVYWTSGRAAGNPTTYDIYGANLAFNLNPAGNTNGLGYFLPSSAPTGTNPAGAWWSQFTPSLAGGTNSGLSVTTTPTGTNYAFTTNVAAGTPYNNTLYEYPVTPKTGALGTGVPVTPPSDGSQVKYGIKGLYAQNFTNTLWAFWTASTRGRTALYYSPQSAWGTANTPALSPTLLPVPAGLTAVSDASPLIITAPVPTASGLQYQDVAEVTYSGIGPDGNADLYVSRYLPHIKVNMQDTEPTTQLDQVPFPAVTENLTATTTGNVKTGWFQSRDVAWSRTGALNIIVPVTSTSGNVTTVSQTPLLYDNAGKPLFTQAIYDKASGYLVLTGVLVPYAVKPSSGPLGTPNTVYVDAATGRIRFSPALLPTQTFPTLRATFSPMARRLTTDTRADVAPVTFLDDKLKPNDAPGFNAIGANRRWTIWRKTGIAGVGSTATLYYKTQRLTFFLPNSVTAAGQTSSAIGTTITVSGNTTVVNVLLSSVTLNGTDVTKQVDVDYARGRIYFPSNLGAEGQSAVSVTYVPATTITQANPNGTAATITNTDPANTIQWQDEALANALPNSADLVATDSVSGLDTVIDTLVPIQTATNENNVTAFLDPYAGTLAANGTSLNPHKVWLFWNSTRNGTADIYSETIDPRFSPAPTIP